MSSEISVDDLTEDQRQLLDLARQVLPGGVLDQIMADALRAHALLAAGDRAGAITIIERHRDVAREAGMEPALDAILAGL